VSLLCLCQCALLLLLHRMSILC
jgi:hypothetical protein